MIWLLLDGSFRVLGIREQLLLSFRRALPSFQQTRVGL